MDTGEVLGLTSGVRLLGWRVWTVREGRDGVRLGSVLHDAIWTPGAPAQASCAHRDHRVVPGEGCNCGFHATQDPVDAFSYLYGRDEPRTLGRVLGEVSLSGLIVRTERGWRASEAYPRRLYVRDAEMAAALEVYGVPVLSPACSSASAMSSRRASAGSPTSSYSVARMPSPRRAASG